MAFGHSKNDNGLDLSGVGKSRLGLSGGAPGGKPRFGLPSSGHGFDSSGGSAAGGFSQHTSNAPQGKAHKERRKLILKVVIGVVAALALATTVGVIVYQQSVKNALKPNLDTTALSSVLKSVSTTDDPFWSVIIETDSKSAEQGRGSMENLALVYTDPDNKSISFLWIPTDTRVYIDGYGYRTISDAFSLGQEKGLVSAVATLGGVSISHYFEMNQAGLSRLEQDLGSLGIDTASASRNALATALLKKILGSSSEQLKTQAQDLSTCVATDVAETSLYSLLQPMQGMNTDSDLYEAVMPSSSQVSGTSTYSVVTEDLWTTMVTRVGSGMPPTATKKELSDSNTTRASTKITIWNGVGVSGVADDCAKHLKKLGWKVDSTGNAAQFVYDETLIVYKDSSDEAIAEMVATDMGQGRVVRSAARYSFSGQILVVVGKDYHPY